MAIGDFMGGSYDFGGLNTGQTPMFGAGATLDPNVQATFAGQPEAYWAASRLANLGDYGALPQFQRAATMGYQPALGRYLMASPTTAAGELMPFSGYAPDPAADRTQQWQDVVAASASLAPGGVPTANARQLTMAGLLSGENARRNALAIAQSQMGGGVGYLANARQRALGNIYDLYSARAGAAGSAPGTFLNWLSDRI